MDMTQLLNTFLALAFVLALMGILAFAAKRMGLSQAKGMRKSNRLLVVESLPLDHKRKAVLLKRDHKEHLVILSPNGETVVETGIPSHEEDNGKAYVNPFE